MHQILNALREKCVVLVHFHLNGCHLKVNVTCWCSWWISNQKNFLMTCLHWGQQSIKDAVVVQIAYVLQTSDKCWLTEYWIYGKLVNPWQELGLQTLSLGTVAWWALMRFSQGEHWHSTSLSTTEDSSGWTEFILRDTKVTWTVAWLLALLVALHIICGWHKDWR